MADALQIASLFGVLELRDTATQQLRNFDSGLAGAEQRIKSAGANVIGFGANISAFFAPVAAGLGLATAEATSFDTAMTNVGAILGYDRDQMAGLSAEVLAIGEDAVAGPQAVAEAFAEVVGGVQDASTHMSILEAAIATAEAGSAELAGTTSAMVAVMNSYGLAADRASFASDVLTATVGAGVGTMDELAAAVPDVAGLANSLSIEFDDLGGMMAYVTTKGNSFSQAGTQIRGMMVALLNPNEKMKRGLAEIGFESGAAAVEALGLVGTFEALSQSSMAGEMAAMTGSVEALNGVIALTGEGAAQFLTDFTTNVEGATEAARAIQLDSPAAQAALFRSEISALSIEIGTVFLPVVQEIFEQLRPVIATVVDWIRENPELVSQIGMIAGALVALGPVLMVAGGAITGIGAAISFILSPIGIAVAAVAALGAAYMTNFGGVRDFIDGTVRPLLDQFFVWLGGVWEQVRPGLEQLYNWFVNEALPAVVDFVTGTVLPAVQEFFDFVGDVWALVSPALGDLFEWFMSTGLPAIRDFITGPVFTAIRGFRDLLVGIWNAVRPALESLFGWFRDTFSQIGGFIEDVIEKFNELKGGLGAWEGVGDNANVIGEGLASGQFNVGDVLGAAFGATLDEFGLRDSGGPGQAGQPYMIGTGAQPELFVPNTDGYFIPNADRLLAGAGGGMNFEAGSVVIYANSRAEGAAAADGFAARIDELYRRRG